MKRAIESSSTSNNTIVNNQKQSHNVDIPQHHPQQHDKQINDAKANFLRRVSDGISYLVDRHGYSDLRATEVILNEIRKSDPLPSDDEVSK